MSKGGAAAGEGGRRMALSDRHFGGLTQEPAESLTDGKDFLLKELGHLRRRSAGKAKGMEGVRPVHTGEGGVGFQAIDQVIALAARLELGGDGMAVLADAFVNLLPITAAGDGIHKYIF